MFSWVLSQLKQNKEKPPYSFIPNSNKIKNATLLKKTKSPYFKMATGENFCID